jgi:D-alanyl-D-alanine carboxypeptidase
MADDVKVEAYLTATVALISAGRVEIEGALCLIRDEVKNTHMSLAMRLLALRRYLRMGSSKVVAQWAWTAEQTRMNMGSGGGKRLYELAARTQVIFSEKNQGYRLSVSPLRSLQKQAHLWVINNSVQTAARQLLTDTLTLLEATDYPDLPTSVAVSKFRAALRHAAVTPEPTSAAPGTSDHGQGHAVDFVVTQGDKIIADTKTEQIPTRWKKNGWEKKLIDAIDDCNREQREKQPSIAPSLSGPLKKPYEPWHWVLKYVTPQ